MGKSQDYVFTQDYKAVYVVATGMPHKPSSIKFKKFRKGEIIKGVLHSPYGKPEFVMIDGIMVVPTNVLRKVITKTINGGGQNSFDGTGGSSESTSQTIAIKKPVDPKIQYMDAMLIGGVVGLVLTHIAEKKEWIGKSEENPYQNKLIGAAVGAAVGAYIVFKTRSKKVVITKKQ
jgi:hypothetical protein